MRLCHALCVLLALIPAVPAQQAPPSLSAEQTMEANFKAYIELLRRDIKKDKVAVTTELMGLSSDEAAKFWPIYSNYDKELTKLGDERIAIIRTYAENYSSLTNQQATSIVNGLMDAQLRRIGLQKKYFQQISQALNPKLAARFVQIEHQLLLVLDLQVAASLPVVE